MHHTLSEGIVGYYIYLGLIICYNLLLFRNFNLQAKVVRILQHFLFVMLKMYIAVLLVNKQAGV